MSVNKLSPDNEKVEVKYSLHSVILNSIRRCHVHMHLYKNMICKQNTYKLIQGNGGMVARH